MQQADKKRIERLLTDKVEKQRRALRYAEPDLQPSRAAQVSYRKAVKELESEGFRQNRYSSEAVFYMTETHPQHVEHQKKLVDFEENSSALLDALVLDLYAGDADAAALVEKFTAEIERLT